MSRILHANPVKVLALLLVLAAITLSLFSAEAEAQSRGRGWTVEYQGSVTFYEQEKWNANATLTNLTMSHKTDQIDHVYYGTFKVTVQKRR
ncbi:MAG: hypothetical protein ACYTGV_01400 [Planctomycetota bacterium]